MVNEQGLNITNVYNRDIYNSAENNINDESRDYSRWKIIYPNYINKKKKVNEGRRINLKYCVSDPTVDEIALACKELNVSYVIEKNKYYPKDWLIEGRIRIKLPNQNNDIPNKYQLMKKIGLKLQTIKVNVESNVVINTNNVAKKKKKKKNKE
ncbi:signal recognition particle subunit SRP19 [Plasmodium sp. gorilla clade G3]|nr:signal recognition particle subunit SRP19 [Plasmodium sp. gorilla clade G3]